MRLINPGAGEYADRLTILSLKILYGDAAGKPVDHFQRERNVLVTKLGPTLTSVQGLEPLLELAAVNAALWHKEDELRAYRKTPYDDLEPSQFMAIARCALLIQSLNDRRAQLVGQINTIAGDATGPEKLL